MPQDFFERTPRRCLSVVMPAFDEEATVHAAMEAVLASPWVGQLVVVDDCSRDRTGAIVDELASTDDRVQALHHPVNRGKGAALRTGFARCTQDYVVIQDADLEYDPSEFPKLLAPLLDGNADVVYGSRFAGGESHRVLYFWHSLGNKLLTLISNMVTNVNLTDMETCYKAFRREIIQSVTIEEDRFGFEPEITAKLARSGVRFYEVGISYYGRTYQEGKKIGWRDGLHALVCIAKYGLGRRGAVEPRRPRVTGRPVTRTSRSGRNRT